jgi:hypothetical protein
MARAHRLAHIWCVCDRIARALALTVAFGALGDWESRHFGVVLCVPAAALGAFVVVALFRTTDGPIKLVLPGGSFEGAALPIILWIVVFLAIIEGIEMIWSL